MIREAFSAFLFIILLVRTEAATGEWEVCRTGNGVCIDTSRHRCSQSTVAGFCPGAANIRCCPAPAGVLSTACDENNGLCKVRSTCGTSTLSGLCPGPSNVKCCVRSTTPPSTTTAAPTTGFLPDAPDISDSRAACRTEHSRLDGHCIDRSKCTGGTFNDLCPGSSRILCCVAETLPVPNVQPGALISLNQFTQLFRHVSSTRARALYPYFVDSLNFAEITTCLRLAAYVAQLGHESNGLLYFEELADGSAYQGRLGNVNPGDGKRYKGRGPIQLTGRTNYRNAGVALGRPFEDIPERVGMPSGGFAAAAWYWKTYVGNRDADMGTRAGFDRTTVAINGCRGEIKRCNGVEDRRRRWSVARETLGC